MLRDYYKKDKRITMSRHTQRNQEYALAYGEDHIFGLFIQVFENAVYEISDDGDDGIVVDLDQKTDKLTPEKLVEVADEYGFTIGLPEKIIR